MPKPIITSIYDKNLEVRYNEWYIRNKENQLIKLDLQGKIKCPILNTNISSIVCSKVMEYEGWPRNIDENICKKCNCFISVSIKKFQEQKTKEKTWPIQ